jgi:endo-1,4-beta-xylanase
LLSGDVGAFAATGGAENRDAFTFAVIDAQGPTFQRAWRLSTSRDLSPAWAVEVRVRFGRAVQRGDTGFVRFFARATKATDETGAGRIRVAVQQAGPHYTKSLDTTLSAGGAWQEFLLPFTFAGDYAAGAAELAFGFGFKRQTVEVGGVEVVNLRAQRRGGGVAEDAPSAMPAARRTRRGGARRWRGSSRSGNRNF